MELHRYTVSNLSSFSNYVINAMENGGLVDASTQISKMSLAVLTTTSFCTTCFLWVFMETYLDGIVFRQPLASCICG